MLARLWSVLVLGVAVVACCSLPTVAVAQEDEPAVKDDVKRLPAYFKDVVNEKQKTEIYKVQANFDKQLEGLEARQKELTDELKTLRTQIDEIKDKERIAIEAVLTPTQVAQIKKLRADAQLKLAQAMLKAAEEAAKRAEELATPE